MIECSTIIGQLSRHVIQYQAPVQVKPKNGPSKLNIKEMTVMFEMLKIRFSNKIDKKGGGVIQTKIDNLTSREWRLFNTQDDI